MLAHSIIGQGSQSCLLLHGFLGSGRNLGTLARRLTAARPSLRLIVPDLTGHGASPPLPPKATLETLARDVLDLARHLNVFTPIPWVGHSLGGRVALKACLVDPGAVPHITLLDIAPGPVSADTEIQDVLMAAPARTPDRENMRRFLIDHGLTNEISDWLMMNLVLDAGTYRWRIDRSALAALRSNAHDEDLWPALERPVRTVCIRGGNSAYVSGVDVARFRKAGATVHTLENAGHFIHMDALDPLVALLCNTPGM
jgi:pimeloyl-ACP methyl ester carboxylesterase